MIFLNSLELNLKTLIVLSLLAFTNLANASLVKVEDAGLYNWQSIQKNAPGFGSSGPITINWDPNNDFYSELLSYDSGYSGGAGAFCFYGNFFSCALELSVTAESTIMKLESFTLGYSGDKGIVQYNVIDLATEASVFSGAPWVSGSSVSLIDVNASSDKGFLILFGPDGFNGGINNIAYSYNAYSYNQSAPIPLPTAVWLFGSALIGLIGFSRQSRSVTGFVTPSITF